MDGWVFGYGSLVNRATHGHGAGEDAGAARPASVRGWRRAWRHTALRPVAFLTAVPAPGARMDGLAMPVAARAWAALDEREWAYARVPAGAEGLQIYAIPEGRHDAPDRAHPVLLSYLDTVAQGYLREFGAAGVARFFNTTDGWDAPIARDREAPLYRRARALDRAERALVDRHLAARGCRFVEPPRL